MMSMSCVCHDIFWPGVLETNPNSSSPVGGLTSSMFWRAEDSQPAAAAPAAGGTPRPRDSRSPPADVVSGAPSSRERLKQHAASLRWHEKYLVGMATSLLVRAVAREVHCGHSAILAGTCVVAGSRTASSNTRGLWAAWGECLSSQRPDCFGVDFAKQGP